MRSLIFFIAFISLGQSLSAQETISPKELLERAINYHDPNKQWSTFNDSLHIVMKTPKGADRISSIKFNLPKEYFSVQATRDTTVTFYELFKDDCTMRYNGTLVGPEIANDYNMSCDRAQLYKNYYTYLYGLPMKLEDPGTNINHPIERRSFKGTEYLVLKATYDAAVGSDVWYFYFNPNTYALEVYQFFKTNEHGKVIPDSGEYILLSGLETISGIKIPKKRDWYYNKDDQFLGSDVLSKN